MNKMMKKILTIVMAAAVMLQSFIFSPLVFVSAEGGDAEISVYSADFSNDDILKDMEITGLEADGTAHTEVKVEDEALVIQGLKEVTNSSGFARIVLPVDAVLDTDNANGTVSTTKTLSGKIAVEMEFEHNIAAPNSTAAARWHLEFGQGAQYYGEIRFGDHRGDGEPYELLSVSSPKRTMHLDKMPFRQKNIFRMEFDTNKQKFYTADGTAVDFNEGSCDKGIFDHIRISPMARMDETSYVKISRIEVFQLPDSDPNSDSAVLTDALHAMPPKLTEDISAVKESITLPAKAGDVAVVWSSSDASVISDKGVVKRAAADTEVTLTATLKQGSLVYTKTYTMTVSAADGPVEPDEPDPPKPADNRVTADLVYADMKDPLAGWKKSGIYAEMLRKDGALMLRSQNTDINGGSMWSWISGDFNFVLDEDEENGAQLQASQMNGKYAVEIDMETDLSSQRTNAGAAQPGYVDFRIGYRGDPNAGSATWDSSVAMFRFISSTTAPGGSENLIRCTMPASSGVNYGQAIVQRGDRFKIKLIFDTESKTFQYYVDDKLITQSKNNPTGNIPFSPDSTTKQMFSSFLFGMQAVFDEDSYVKIYEIKVTNLETDTSENGGMLDAYKKYAEFPSSVADDCKNVTGDVDVPVLDEVTWSSDTPEVISADGKVNRWVDDVTAKLSGSFNTTNAVGETLKFAKVYHLNVKAREDAEDTVVLEDDPAEAERNWKFSSGKGTHSVENNMLTLTHKGDAAGYSAVRILNVGIPEKQREHEALYSANHQGVYDLEFDAACHVTGEYPIVVETGYVHPATGEFTSIGSLNFSKQGAALGIGSKTQSVQSATDTYKMKLRIDTENKKIWAYSDGNMQTPFAGTEYTGDYYGIVNAVRVFFDPGVNSGDSFSIGNLKLKRKLNVQNSSVNALISAADGIGISAVTDNPNDVSGGIKSLPKQLGGMDVVWECSSNSVDIDTGKVFKSDTVQDIVLTAKIISEYIAVSKEFTFKIPAFSNMTERLESAAHFLEWSAVSNQPIDDIRYDISLPLEGRFGTTVKWSSSKPEIVGHNGAINRQMIIEDGTPVTLTAEISAAGVNTKTEKQFVIHLRRRGRDTKVLSESPVTNPYTFTLDGENGIAVVCNALLDATVSKNGSGGLSVEDSAGRTVAFVQADGNSILLNGSKIGEAFDGTEAKLSVYVMPDINKTAVWVNGVLVADSVALTEEFDDVASVVCTGGITVKNIDMYVDDYGIFEMNIHKYKYLDALGNGYITNNLNLSTESFLGANVEWSFSDSVISNDGMVTADDRHHCVDVLFEIGNSNTSCREAVEVLVPPLAKYNLAVGKQSSTEMFTTPGYPLQNAFDGDRQTYFAASVSSAAEPAVTLTLNNAEYINTVYVDENIPSIGGYTVAYSNDGNKWTELKSVSITNQLSRLITFDVVNPKYLRISFADVAGNKVSISEIGAYLEVNEEKTAEIDINSVVLDTTKQITERIDLPNTGKYGTSIYWTSSDPSVISASGVYTAPAYDTKVTLTAYATVNGKRYEKTFEVYAKGKEGAKGGSVVSGGSSGGGGSASPAVMPAEVSTADAVTGRELFSDVARSHWAYEYIKNLTDAGIVDGVGNGRFEPNSAVTREQFLKMLLIAGKISSVNDETIYKFSDVSPEAWYFSYVSTAKREGIVNGISDSLFGIGQNISRQDMSVMMWRVLSGMGVESGDAGVRFADHGDISEYAAEAVYKLKSLGVVQGYGNMFNPMDNLTRAEAAAVISALCGIVDK